MPFRSSWLVWGYTLPTVSIALGALTLQALQAQPRSRATVALAPRAHPAEKSDLRPARLFMERWSFPQAMRGVTVGPIENQRHPGRGYGSGASARTMHEIREIGANWVSITPFGRVADSNAATISMSFEAPFRENRNAVSSAIAQAHAEGLRVMLVPHLWVESGEWRGHINPGERARWSSWARAYDSFITSWASVAEHAHVDLFAVGIELRSWVTTEKATSFLPILKRVRSVYSGPLIYAANWDDCEDTVIWGDLDFIGINAFYPLATNPNTSYAEMAIRAAEHVARANELARRWNKPVIFTEFGYTTRKDATLRPWEWPESLSEVIVDERSQAQGYRALLAAAIEQPWLGGVFVWRVYADPDDVTQEPEYGFSFRGKLAELELQDAFNRTWAADGMARVGTALRGPAHRRTKTQ